MYYRDAKETFEDMIHGTQPRKIDPETMTQEDVNKVLASKGINYIYDFRLMTPEQEAEIKAKMKVGDSLTWNPTDPEHNWQNYLPPEMHCNMTPASAMRETPEARRRFGTQTDLEYQQDQEAKAAAYRAHNEMIEKLLGNEVYFQKRKAFLEKTNGIPLFPPEALKQGTR